MNLVNPEEEQENIKKISRLLEMGATMLAQHCEGCGAPMFRYSGQVVCPVCDVEMKSDSPRRDHVSETSPQSSIPDNKEDRAVRSQETTSVPQHPPSRSGAISHNRSGTGDEIDQAADLIAEKILDISSSLQNENDPRRLHESFELIEKGLILFEKMKRFR
ncbi:Sjogren's syndrome/scleroderma autoantigen 1 family protein [Methanosalsum zhilinae]|nr:Sjogren's syndrome/scleroderma autoantigen 1 family protein [Methanosalsum zhilinae]